MTYALYKNNELQRKQFKAPGMNSIWTQYNRYCKARGCREYITGSYVGQLAWHNAGGDIYEVREVA